MKGKKLKGENNVKDQKIKHPDPAYSGHGNDPFFVEKVERAKANLAKYGFPKGWEPKTDKK